MDKISILIIKKINRTITQAEETDLERWMGDNPRRHNLVERLTNPAQLDEEYTVERKVNSLRAAKDMERRIADRRKKRYYNTLGAVAAMVAILSTVAALWLLTPRDILNEVPAETIASATPTSIDELSPGKTGAVFTTTSGKKITLNASDTSLVTSSILALTGVDADDSIEKLNLEVGRGQEFKVVLEDSSVVWLNSESTLSYPEMFDAHERRVHVSGEAYFAIATDSLRPFYVETDQQTVRVYGTSFNVRAYPDDPYIYTTLEKGSISISRSDLHSAEVRLSPGHQALLNREDCKLNLLTVNPGIITGWRHGRFVFENQPLSVIMRDLARWYDFEYEFEQPELADIIFMGSIPRYSDFAVARRILERSGDIELRLIDNKILITQHS